MLPLPIGHIVHIALALALCAACGSPQARQKVSKKQPKAKIIKKGTSLFIVEEDNEAIPVKIHFEVDSDVLRTRSYHPLNVLATFLYENSEFTNIEVHGHTDARGSREYNLDLSQRRADSVISYLVEKGIAPSRFVGKGFGATRPATEGSTEVAWSDNRRVEFVITKRRAAR